MTGKRLFDLAVAGLGLLLLAPLFAVIALAIRRDSPGPVFFRQVRVGQHGHPFRIWKFRTMRDDRVPGSPLTIGADARITAVGQVLRRWKLDELPQLINVAAGEMSLVGPRPEVQAYVALYDPYDRSLVLSVRPGITDLASIRFHDENAILARAADPHRAYAEEILPRKLRLCRYYVRHQSFVFDLRVLLKTLCVLARRR